MGIIEARCCCDADDPQSTVLGSQTHPALLGDQACVKHEETIEAEEKDEADEDTDVPVTYKPGLEVTIVGAKGLRNADFSFLPFTKNLSDPYCICEIEGKPLSRTVTEVVKDNLNPVWNHVAQFGDFEPGDRLLFSIMDKDVSWKKDDFLGRCQRGGAEFYPHGLDSELLLSEAGKNRKAYLHVRVAPAVEEVRKKAVKVIKVASTVSITTGVKKAPPPKPAVKYRASKPCGNSNLPGAYIWLKESLQHIAANKFEATPSAGSRQAACTGDNKAKMTPLLFVIGGCPNAMCGMQAVMFAADASKQIDFWWVKPRKNSPTELEEQTLCLHASGTHKNAPGRSGPFYQPLADLFQQGCTVRNWTFGLEMVPQRNDTQGNDAQDDNAKSGGEVVRAFIQNKSAEDEPLYILCMWQEDFPLNPFASSKYIKGKLVYQKSFDTGEYFSRQYEIRDGVSMIADFEEGPVNSVLPGDEIKTLWEVDS